MYVIWILQTCGLFDRVLSFNQCGCALHFVSGMFNKRTLHRIWCVELRRSSCGCWTVCEVMRSGGTRFAINGAVVTSISLPLIVVGVLIIADVLNLGSAVLALSHSHATLTTSNKKVTLCV